MLNNKKQAVSLSEGASQVSTDFYSFVFVLVCISSPIIRGEKHSSEKTIRTIKQTADKEGTIHHLGQYSPLARLLLLQTTTGYNRKIHCLTDYPLIIHF